MFPLSPLPIQSRSCWFPDSFIDCRILTVCRPYCIPHLGFPNTRPVTELERCCSVQTLCCPSQHVLPIPIEGIEKNAAHPQRRKQNAYQGRTTPPQPSFAMATSTHALPVLECVEFTRMIVSIFLRITHAWFLFGGECVPPIYTECKGPFQALRRVRYKIKLKGKERVSRF